MSSQYAHSPSKLKLPTDQPNQLMPLRTAGLLVPSSSSTPPASNLRAGGTCSHNQVGAQQCSCWHPLKDMSRQLKAVNATNALSDTVTHHACACHISPGAGAVHGDPLLVHVNPAGACACWQRTGRILQHLLRGVNCRGNGQPGSQDKQPSTAHTCQQPAQEGCPLPLCCDGHSHQSLPWHRQLLMCCLLAPTSSTPLHDAPLTRSCVLHIDLARPQPEVLPCWLAAVPVWTAPLPPGPKLVASVVLVALKTGAATLLASVHKHGAPALGLLLKAVLEIRLGDRLAAAARASSTVCHTRISRSAAALHKW